jgi:glycosyltransferase involved in cell wall biosynthesis
MKPTITFLLPSHSKYPVGGFKVVYEYANRFVREGYDIRIVYPATVFFNGENFINRIKSALRYVYYKANNQYSPYHWFDLDKKVKIFWVPSLDQKHIPNSDVIVATSAETAERLDNLVCSAKKIYFIQGYETWCNGEERFLETLDLGLTKIVVSPHLLKVVESRGQKAELILNGFDFNYFKKTVDVEDRDKYQIAMLFHLSSAKGCDDGLKSLEIVKDKFPLLKASFFGYPESPKNLPSWIKYIQTPDKDLHNKIYNEAAIFIGTSHSEGWGLTVGEAMICGCAVACTNIDGYNIMAKDEDTALLNEPGDFQSMAENIIRLIDNDKMRYQIAKKGSNTIQNYKWDESYNIFKKIVKIKW